MSHRNRAYVARVYTLEVDGAPLTLTLRAWAARTPDLTYSALYQRLRRKVPLAEALATPRKATAPLHYLTAADKTRIARALYEADDDVGAAARTLGKTPQAVHWLIEKYPELKEWSPPT